MKQFGRLLKTMEREMILAISMEVYSRMKKIGFIQRRLDEFIVRAA